MNAPVIVFQWDGEAMRPLRRFHNVCNAEYVVGDMYRCEVIEERSVVSHRHYFATLHDYWLNLPEEQAERFPTDEHLRKYALIKCGYADQRQQVCASHAEALRFAAFIRPIDTYALVTVKEAVVTIWTAQSQSMKAMGKQQFQESKTAVLDWCASLLGIDRNETEGGNRTDTHSNATDLGKGAGRVPVPADTEAA